MKKTKVLMMEYEAGWGSKVDETKTFKTRALAEKFCKDYNKKYNNKKSVPSWYIKPVIVA